jgi:hypothetical protein
MGRRTLLSTTACLTMMDVAKGGQGGQGDQGDQGGMNAWNKSL